jgi:hypothetical protein
MLGRGQRPRIYTSLSPVSRPWTQWVPVPSLPVPLQALKHLEKDAMQEVIVLAIGLGFFALSILYGVACDRL